GLGLGREHALRSRAPAACPMLLPTLSQTLAVRTASPTFSRCPAPLAGRNLYVAKYLTSILARIETEELSMASTFPESVGSRGASPVSIDAGALEHLRYIRDTIEAAHTFTSVPGKGCIAMGLTALVAAGLDSIAVLAPYWLPIWLTAAATAIGLSSYFLVKKAKEQGLCLWGGVARRFFLTLLPALVAGAVLTIALLDSGARDLVSGAWLLLYGAGLAASGVF